MAKSYAELSSEIQKRINPYPFSIHLSESARRDISAVASSDILVFIRTAMAGVPAEYTQASITAGERVKDHLSHLQDVTFKYQGSVMTNTHIKSFSDIDLLVISEKFYTRDISSIQKILESEETKRYYYQSSIEKMERENSLSVYLGNSREDLKVLRKQSEEKLSLVYKNCDITKDKCISIENLDLHRKVDIVVSNWYDDVKSVINNKGEYRGIQIFNKRTEWPESPDYPFLSISRINQRGNETNGRLKRMIRFLKNIKASSDYKIDLSSFDINAICYDIKPSDYQYLKFYQLVPVLYRQLSSIVENKSHSDNLTSIDEREYIFRYNQSKLDQLKGLLGELRRIIVDLPLESKIPNLSYIN